ncbi:MAG: hypothetical protein GQE15_11255 [Archangiaceae bacterium]|nr:hypothetical protein [Archangiaceae bacterium]
MKSKPVVVVAALLLLGGGAVFIGSQVLERRALDDQARRADELEYAARWDLDHGQPQQALEKLKGLAAIDPARKGLTALEGRALVSNGSAADGANKLQQAGASLDLEGSEYLAVAHSQLGRLAEAKAVLEGVVAKDASRVSAWRRLAQVRLTSGDTAGAVDAWSEALKHAGPDEAAVRAEATTLLTQAGKADEAKRFTP